MELVESWSILLFSNSPEAISLVLWLSCGADLKSSETDLWPVFYTEGSIFSKWSAMAPQPPPSLWFSAATALTAQLPSSYQPAPHAVISELSRGCLAVNTCRIFTIRILFPKSYPPFLLSTLFCHSCEWVTTPKPESWTYIMRGDLGNKGTYGQSLAFIFLYMNTYIVYRKLCNFLYTMQLTMLFRKKIDKYKPQ